MYGWNSVPLKYEKMSVVDGYCPAKHCPSESTKKIRRSSKLSKVLSPNRNSAGTVKFLDSADTATRVHI